MAGKNKVTTSLDERLRRDLVFVNNPVLVSGLALAPVVMAATNLRNGLILSLGVAILCTPVRFLGNLLIGYIPQRLRALVYSIIAAAIMIPCVYVETKVFGTNITSYVGLYLPLLAVDSIILSRTEIPGRESIPDVIINGILTTIGFGFAACIIGAVREIFSSGTLLGNPLAGFVWTIPITGLACGGFIVTALLAAFWQYLVNNFKRILYRRQNLWK